MSTNIQFDFSENAKQFAPSGIFGINMAKDIPAIFAKIKKFDPVVNELNIFKSTEN